jgi:hypothetical protein
MTTIFLKSIISVRFGHCDGQPRDLKDVAEPMVLLKAIIFLKHQFATFSATPNENYVGIHRTDEVC